MLKKEKTIGIKQLTTDFWALSRKRKESFLKEVYDLSPQNKDFFRIRLGKADKSVMTSLEKEIHKETINRIGRYRKLRLSKLNEILRNANKYALSMLDQIQLKKEVWIGMLTFLLSQRHVLERYEIACARHLDQYITMIKHHVLETSERDDRLEETKQKIEKFLNQRKGFSFIEEVFFKHFPSPKY